MGVNEEEERGGGDCCALYTRRAGTSQKLFSDESRPRSCVFMYDTVQAGTYFIYCSFVLTERAHQAQLSTLPCPWLLVERREATENAAP